MNNKKFSTDEKNHPKNKLNTGTVFMGPSPDKESSLKQVIGTHEQEVWNRRTVSEYMTRVRERATIHVQAMLDKARANAETIRKTAKQWAEKTKKESDKLHKQAQQALKEAERIREEADHIRELAHEEGYRLGIEQAQEEIKEQIKSIHMTAASILKTIERQYTVIFDNWRSDLVKLLHTATEVATDWILSKEHTAILDSVLNKAVQQLEERQRVTIRVNPNNKNTIIDLITNIKNQFPELKNWEIKIDVTMGENDVIVESRSGMVDSNSQLRKEEVRAILQRLIIPESEIDIVAAQSIADIADITGITALSKEAAILQHTPVQNDSSEKTPSSKETLSPNDKKPISPAEIDLINPPSEEVEFTFPELEGIELPPDIPQYEINKELSSGLSSTDESTITNPSLSTSLTDSFTSDISTDNNSILTSHHTDINDNIERDIFSELPKNLQMEEFSSAMVEQGSNHELNMDNTPSQVTLTNFTPSE